MPNVAINLAVVALCSALLRAEIRAGERRLQRMSRGARIAALRVEDLPTRQVLPLKDLRGRSRVVLVAGPAGKLAEAMDAAREAREGLANANLLVVPFVTDGDLAPDAAATTWRMQPHAREEWSQWCASEIELAKAQVRPAADDVLVVIIRLDGKVGARSFGAPMWTRLIAEVSKLPTKDQYGKPKAF